jgi:predicted dehydrogenase
MNVLVIGSGHYVSGYKNEKLPSTDKECGVILPSLFYLYTQKVISTITIAAGDGHKANSVKAHIKKWSTRIFQEEILYEYYPQEEVINYDCYKTLVDKNEYDLAFVCTPDSTHFNILHYLTINKVPAFIVKPAVINLQEFYILNKLITENDNLVYVDYHKVFDEANIKLFNLIKTNALGQLQHIYSQQTQKRLMIDVYGNSLDSLPVDFINYYLGSHYIHMTSFLTQATPISVRQTAQMGYIKNKLNKPICDLTQTSVDWHLDNNTFSSFHIAGWNDSNHGNSMTYQFIEAIGSNGRATSDQRFRGYTESLNDSFVNQPNPYFFDLALNYQGQFDPSSSYGFKSINSFINLVRAKTKPSNALNIKLPLFSESENVTAILTAASASLRNDSSVIKLVRHNQQYRIEE